MAIKLLICDFDGTLVDTFEANFRAYQKAFESVEKDLSRTDYMRCFGLRFDRFMDTMGIEDQTARDTIRTDKGRFYPEYFQYLKVNNVLVDLIRTFRKSGGKTAIASTARRRNLTNALSYIGADKDFDLILAGEDVQNGKPDPEIYNTVLSKMGINASDSLVFEDSEVGFKAAENAGIQYIKVNKQFFQ